MPASCAAQASSRSEGADDRTAEKVSSAADADSLETCSAIAAAISGEVLRFPASAKATIASASEGSTLAATVTLRAWFTSLALLTSCSSATASATLAGDGEQGCSARESGRDLRQLWLDELPAAGADSRATWPLRLETGGAVLELRRGAQAFPRPLRAADFRVSPGCAPHAQTGHLCTPGPLNHAGLAWLSRPAC